MSSVSNSCMAPAPPENYGLNNINYDPQFVNFISGNYRLGAASPCVNTGTNQAWMPDALDLDGHSRLDRFSRLADMGCYEFVTVGTMYIIK